MPIRILGSILVVLAIATPALAQFDTASLVGTVRACSRPT
jgi:hypothetical protein